MESDSSSIDQNRRTKEFWRIFCRVMEVKLEPVNHTCGDVDEWDSLRHVELIFELEERFSVDIDPEQIVTLYSSTDRILEFLARASSD